MSPFVWFVGVGFLVWLCLYSGAQSGSNAGNPRPTVWVKQIPENWY